MNDVTRILQLLEQGELTATDSLLPLVYEELRQMAASKLNHEKPGQTLSPTALVHEAYLRLVKSAQEKPWANHRHFFAAAAEAMRRILINRARDKKRLKRGGGAARVHLESIELAWDTPSEALVALDDGLERLAGENPQHAELVKLRFFGGLTIAQAAECLGISRRTAERNWAYARAWLWDHLSAEGGDRA